MKGLAMVFGVFLVALIAVIYIHKTQPHPQGSIVPIYIRIDKNSCGNFECRKACSQKGYGYEGYRLVRGGGAFGKPVYECFCLK